MTYSVTADVAVLGAGFAGGLVSLLLAKRGYRVALIERGRHPRFALGESTTPLGNLALELLAAEENLPWLRDLAEWGPWKRTHPQLTCGLKRGFTFVEHRPNVPYVAAPGHAGELLVAASPDDERADTHWLRADVDAFFTEMAKKAGVNYFDSSELKISHAAESRWVLNGERLGDPLRVEAGFLIDATGRPGLLADEAGVGPELRTASWSVFNHFRDVPLWQDILRESGGDPSRHPYPCDAAALHHVIDGGWIWVLRFDDGRVSAGVLYDAHRVPPTDEDPAAVWVEMLLANPGVARQFANATKLLPWMRTGRLQARVAKSAGPDWAKVSSAVYSLDALYSTGIAHTLWSVRRLVRDFDRFDPVRYDAMMQHEINHLDALVSGTYRSFSRFDLLTTWAMTYFACAINAEEGVRKGRPGADEWFLSAGDEKLTSAIRSIREDMETMPDAKAFRARTAERLAPWNTTGLLDPAKGNLYPY